ncbi:MAG: thiamine pyrophosphate-dependent enzyme, partial [bacterium]
MSHDILAHGAMPFCPGCGHTVVTKNMGKAVAKLGLTERDVVVVSDIGCCSLIDGLLSCHTVHGLHGRATALATGIRYGVGEGKKVIAFQGDGGATIGLQHLLEAARRNVDITLVVLNNLVYSMTGGQRSGLSPRGFKDEPAAAGGQIRPYDICELARCAGAAFVARTFIGGDTAEIWEEALTTKGFSLIEIVENCPAHGIKKLKDLKETLEYGETIHRANHQHVPLQPRDTESLFAALELVPALFAANVDGPIGIILAGSAGEGVQSAGQLLTKAGMLAGLQATNKGEYPITVGTGFSVAEVILSPEKIQYTAIDTPHTIIAVSENGLNQVAARIPVASNVVVDDSLQNDVLPAGCVRAPFREKAGAKGAALAAVAYWMRTTGAIPPETLDEAIRGHRH